MDLDFFNMAWNTPRKKIQVHQILKWTWKNGLGKTDLDFEIAWLGTGLRHLSIGTSAEMVLSSPYTFITVLPINCTDSKILRAIA